MTLRLDCKSDSSGRNRTNSNAALFAFLQLHAPGGAYGSARKFLYNTMPQVKTHCQILNIFVFYNFSCIRKSSPRSFKYPGSALALVVYSTLRPHSVLLVVYFCIRSNVLCLGVSRINCPAQYKAWFREIVTSRNQTALNTVSELLGTLTNAYWT